MHPDAKKWDTSKIFTHIGSVVEHWNFHISSELKKYVKISKRARHRETPLSGEQGESRWRCPRQVVVNCLHIFIFNYSRLG